jgi:hypothetical protein
MSLILCTCGCCQQREEYDSRGDCRKYIRGHYGRGKKRSSIICQKISDTKIRNPPPPESRQKIADANSRRYWSPEIRQKLSKSRKERIGKDAPGWKSGIYPVNEQIRHSDKYVDWRTQIFGRDNFTC